MHPPWPISTVRYALGLTLGVESEIPADIVVRRHYDYHKSMMDDCLRSGQLRQALASTQPGETCGENCRAELLEELRLKLLALVLVSRRLPEYLARPDLKDVFSRLMALEILQNNSFRNKLIFNNIVRAYYPNNVKMFFDTFTMHIHNDTHRQKFCKDVRSAMERSLFELLQRMKKCGSKTKLRELQKKFSDLIQAMAIPLHDDTVPAIPDYPGIEFRSKADHCPLFTRAVKLKLAPEALLLYDAGAVGNKELRVLAKDPDVQKMLKDEEDKFLAVFLRKVLHKPRSLQSLAEMHVSRLLWCHAPEDKEQRARGLGLLDIDVERVLLRGQCGRYRAALKQADDEDKAGAS